MSVNEKDVLMHNKKNGNIDILYPITKGSNVLLDDGTTAEDIKSEIPTNVSELTNDSGYLTSHQDISGKEDKTNKVTTITSTNTNTQYPSAKAVYDYVASLPTSSGGSSELVKTLTVSLAVANWTQNQTTELYEYDITNTNITTSTLVNVYLDITNQAKMTGNAYTESYNGGFKIITDNLPTEAITANVTYQLTSGGNSQ